MAIATGTALGLGGLALAGMGAKYLGNRAQREEAKKAQKIAEARLNAGTDKAINYYQEGYDSQISTINQYTDAAKEALNRGDDAAAKIYQEKAAQAEQSLMSGYGKARTDLGAGYDQARSDLGEMAKYSKYGEAALTGEGFDTSPGYQFRLQQGQDAMAKMQAASGGRYGGAAMKKALEYGQGFASSEYDKWAGRAAHLGDVGFEAQGRMADYAAQRGQGMAGLDTGEGTALANLYGQTGTYLGNLEQSRGTNMANFESSRGQNLAGVRNWLDTGRANAELGQASQMAQLAFTPVQYAGQEWNALSDALGGMGQMTAYGYGAGMFRGGGGGYSPSPYRNVSSIQTPIGY